MIAVVTGAASGIGAALCAELARSGARVVGADLQPTGSIARVDVTSAAEVEALAAAAAHVAWWLSRISPSATDWLSHQLASLARRTAR